MSDEGLNRKVESEESRNIEQQSLEDVTVNPRESVEQTGEYKEAEIIQTALTDLVENVSAEGDLEPETQLISSTLQTAEALPQVAVSQGTSEIITDPVEVQSAPEQMLDVEGEEGDVDFRRLEEVRTVKQDRPTDEAQETKTSDTVRGAQAILEEQEPAVENSHEVLPSIEGEVAEPGEAIEPETGDVVGQGEGDEPEAIGEEEEVWIPPEMYVHVDSEGNLTVVDGDGKAMDSPPIIYTLDDHPAYAGKYFIAYPGSEPAFNPDGTLINPSALIEIPHYIGTTDGLYLHQDKEGNLTVVDANGKAVDSPPIIYTLENLVGYAGKYYITYPGSESAFNPDGTPNDLSVLIEVPLYVGPTEGLYLHQDQQGNLTVVDADGKAVDSPPIIYTLDDLIEYQGKYFITYPGSEPAYNPDGMLINPGALIEIQFYNPQTATPPPDNY